MRPLNPTPPWRWPLWGPWPPERPAPTPAEIKRRAQLLSTLDPLRSPEENWIQAEKELSDPVPLTSFVRWLGFSKKTGWDWLNFLASLSVPAFISFGVWWLGTQETERRSRISQEEAARQYNISSFQRDSNIIGEYMKEIRSLLVDTDLKTHEPDSTKRRLIRNLTLSALNQINTPENRTLVARFLLCGADPEKLEITPPINYSSANLIKTDLKGCRLQNTDLSWSFINGADLRGAVLEKSTLRHAVLSHADLRGVSLTESMLFNAIMKHSRLSFADLSKADISMADLSYSDLRKATLEEANLGSTKFIDGKPQPSNEKNPHGAILKGAKLQGSTLTKADLSDADLSGANLASGEIYNEVTHKTESLKGADLTGANLIGANLSDVKWDGSTRWPELSKMKQARNIPAALRKELGL